MKKVLLLTALLILSVVVTAQTTKAVIYFPFNQSALTNRAIISLDSAIKKVKNSKIDSVRILGYCDSTGSNTFNDKLSLNRAMSVKHYLWEINLTDSSLIYISWFGKRKPVNDNSTELSRALNRRAEIVFFIKPVTNLVVKQVIKPDTFKPAAPSLMDTIKEGENFILKNINFYGGLRKMYPSSLPVMDTLVKLLNEYPKVEIEIQGYVCCTPEGEDGQDFQTGAWNLSVERAKVVYNYLIEKGIDPQRLSYKGCGSKPLVSELTEEDMETNRRVEIKVLKK